MLENLIEDCGFVEEDFYNAEDFFDSARVYYNDGNNNKALDFFVKAKELGYDNYLVDTWLVYTNMNLGNFDLAENILSRIVEYDYPSKAGIES